MPARLRSLTIRARLLILGGGAAVALVVLALVSTLMMSRIGTKTDVNAASEKQAQAVSHAYESWILNDAAPSTSRRSRT